MTLRTIEVVVPVQNMADHLAEALPPLLKQLSPKDKITVVNDASSDATESVARRCGVNVITVAHSRGPYYARQLAAVRSEADVLLFVDARSRALPGLIDAHRDMHSADGVALSCSEVRTRSGPSLAARVAALRQGMSLRNHVDVPHRPPYFTTANLGINHRAFVGVGGFRHMRSGADADICWRIQKSGLGSFAVDRRPLMEWEPRNSIRDLASQRMRYGKSTAYLEWVYGGDISPTGPAMPLYARVLSRPDAREGEPNATIVETIAMKFTAAAYAYGYWTAKRESRKFTQPTPYDMSVAIDSE
jgi:glycosyltransferase involved in cell wall biosynthesis